MDAFDQVVDSFRQALATEQQPLPRITFGAVDRDGSLNYSKSFRDTSGSSDDCPDTDAVHWVASCTKLITTIAVLQCVEKGLMELDQDISTVLPEWKHPNILTGFDESDQPLFRPARSIITLRHLLTHSSGMSYSWMHPLMQRHQELHGPLAPIRQTIKGSYHLFLVGEPGEQWIYSPSIDWAGLMVERVNGGMKLGEYMKRFIFDPLGIRDATFHLEDREDMRARKVKLWERIPEGLKEMKTPFWPDPIVDDMGGGGLYSTVSELLKLYRGLLRGELLGTETVKAMFLPQLYSTTGLDKPEEITTDHRNAIRNVIPNGIPVNFGLGGLLNTVAVPGKRRSHSLTWSGMPNCYWWVDFHSGIAGVFLSQLLPTGDGKAVQLLAEFEKAVYATRGNLYN